MNFLRMFVKEEPAGTREFTLRTIEFVVVSLYMHIHGIFLESSIVTLVTPVILYLIMNTFYMVPHMGLFVSGIITHITLV